MCNAQAEKVKGSNGEHDGEAGPKDGGSRDNLMPASGNIKVGRAMAQKEVKEGHCNEGGGKPKKPL